MRTVKALWIRAFPTVESQAFLRWGLGAYGVTTAVLLVNAVRTSDGTMIYALDDPAIHLSVAQNLVDHGTWGVTPGHFQSASSSPLWTLLVAAFVGVAPFAADWAALVLNVAASVAVIALFARLQSTFRPSLRRPLDVAAVVALVVVVLFLPAATFVGMEHVLHLALVLAAFHLLFQERDRTRSRIRRLAPFLLVALATLTRLETAFLAAGLGAAMLVTPPRATDVSRRLLLRARLPHVLTLAVASGGPLLAYGIVNQLMGQGWLPNSVMAKSASLNGQSPVPPPREILGRVTQDPVVAVLVSLCLGLVAVGWHTRRSWVLPAFAVVVTTLLHATFAKIGWYERYQIYLIGLAVYVFIRAAPELLANRVERSERTRVAPLLVLILLMFTATKAGLTVAIPRAVNDTYSQRYQAARFLDTYYDGDPIATGELGYISLEHRGPITDLFGLGDYEVLQARIHTPPEDRKEYWRQLTKRRGFRVAAVYPQTLFFDTPDEWVLVGTWEIQHRTVTAYDRRLQFYATVPEEAAPLAAHLEAFEDELPPSIRPSMNEMAQFRAAVLIDEREGS